jgi:mono/diheme cytochrome c family protein
LRIIVLVLLAASAAVPQETVKPLTPDQVKKLKNPVPYSKKSISQGRGTFARYCVGCHGPDGKATVDVIADATDLTAPKTWKDGTTDGEIFRSIRDGQNDSMPAFKTQLRQDEDMWNLVNFIHSLWPESTRPPLQESNEPTGKSK